VLAVHNGDSGTVDCEQIDAGEAQPAGVRASDLAGEGDGNARQALRGQDRRPNDMPQPYTPIAAEQVC
jgi:hypothetical protein